MNKIQYVIERLVNTYNSYYTKIEKEILRKQNEFLVDQANNSLIRKKTSSISPDDLKIIYKNVKNNRNYKEYNNDLFNDLKRNGTKKENERDNILPKENSVEKDKKGEEEEIHFFNHKKGLIFPVKKISNKINKNYSSSIEKDNSRESTKRNKSIINLDTSLKSTSISRIYEKNSILCKIKIKKPKRFFLPPISSSVNNTSYKSINNYNNSNNDVSLNDSITQNLTKSVLPYTSRNKNPIFINLNKKTIKVPLRIEKNIPLINKLKMEIINSNDSKPQNKKIIFNTIIKGFPNSQTLEKTIDKSFETNT